MALPRTRKNLGRDSRAGDVADDYEAEGPFEVESPSDVAAAVDTGACSEGALLRLVAPTSRGAVADFDDRLAIDSYCAELEVHTPSVRSQEIGLCFLCAF